MSADRWSAIHLCIHAGTLPVTGATETVTAVAPQGDSLDMHVAYCVGVGGHTATYEVNNSKANTNVGFDLW
jgi:hypothetical protein